MPRIREKRGQAVHELSVSPWMTKKGLREGAEPKQPAGPPPSTKRPLMYSVGLADAPLIATASSNMGSSLDQQQLQFEHGKQQLSAQLQLAPIAVASNASVLQQRQPQHAESPASHAAGTGWHQVCRPSRTPAQRQNPKTTAASYQQPEQAFNPAAAATAAAHDRGSAGMLQESVAAGRAHHLQQQQQQEHLQATLSPGVAPWSGECDMPTIGNTPWLDILLSEADSSTTMQQLQQQLQQQQSPTALTGVAQLVLHPSGSISGHFIANTSNSSSSNILPQQQQHAQCGTPLKSQQQQQQRRALCLGLQGKQVLGLHSCYRDPEWALLQLSVIKYSNGSSSSGGGAKRGRDSSNGGSHACRTTEEQQIAAGLKDCEMGKKRLCREKHTEGSQQQQRRQQQQQEKDDAPAAVEALGSTNTLPSPAEQDPQQQQQQQQQQQFFHPEAAAAAMSDKAVGFEATAAATMPGTDVQLFLIQHGDDVAFEAEAWVQRTGGDLATLQPADMEDEDTAEVVTKDSLGLQPDFAQVHFTPHTLLAGAAADKQLAQTWPGLVGSGVVVNIGEMSMCNLPAGMLDC